MLRGVGVALCSAVTFRLFFTFVAMLCSGVMRLFILILEAGGYPIPIKRGVISPLK